jgi:RNA polymerase sigma-70 factor (ECF subfamily)
VDEKRAIAQLKCGNLAGLETLVNTYQLQAVRAAALVTGDTALAEDIVQNAFIRAAEKIDQFDSQRPFGPWFYRSVVNDAIKAMNRQKRQVSMDDDDRVELALLVDSTPLPEESVEDDETRMAVWRALEALSPKQRAAIVLRYYLEMDEKEMAGELHSPTGTIKWWLHTARKRLGLLLRPSQSLAVESGKVKPVRSESDHKAGDKS